MNINLKGKRAIVTGGNSGLGAAIALGLVEAGAKVMINYLTHPEAAESMMQKINNEHGDAMVYQADISDADAIAQMFEHVDKVWGGVDILINNAGLDGERALAWQSDIPAWRKVIEVNLFGTFNCAREALRRMITQKGGVILNISSVHEMIAWSGYSAYASSKAAIGMLTKTLAQEASPYGVRVLAVGPGAIKTSINRDVWSDSKGLKDLLTKIPLKRIGEPEEISRMVVVLVSDIASYVTGRTIFVDGGMTDYPNFAEGG